MDAQALSPTREHPPAPAPVPAADRSARWALGRRVVGGFYLVMGGVHLGLVAADTETYRTFADHALLPFVREGWASVFMADPSVWGLLLMAGEVTLGALLLAGPRSARVGWAGVITFHLLLLPFGFWVWPYAVTALAVLAWLAHGDLRRSVP